MKYSVSNTYVHFDVSRIRRNNLLKCGLSVPMFKHFGIEVGRQRLSESLLNKLMPAFNGSAL